MRDLISKINRINCKTNNLKQSKADFAVREVYFSNISKGTAFLLQDMFETDPVIRDVTVGRWSIRSMHVTYPKGLVHLSTQAF